MKKDIEWVISEIEERIERITSRKETTPYNEGVARGLGISLFLINQLDKIDVLSQAWIDENHFETENWAEDLYNSDGEPIDHTPHIKVIAVQDLQKQNLIIPNLELPVIPRFVAEVIEEHKELGYNVYYSIDLIIETNGMGLPSISDWVSGNIDKYARAWLDGFTVEEQKYVLSLNIVDKASKTIYKTFLNKRGIFHSMDNESFNNEEFNWSEEEIKGLVSGEILFEHFAVKVEELME